MARVNLFLIGAMKSGSTTLHEYLTQHSEIFMSEEKEPGFFVPELWKNRAVDEYEQLFSGAGEESYIGESSTHYTKLPLFDGVVDRIKDYNANAKFIYIMRHPIERTISHYFHSMRNMQGFGETRDILAAIAKEPIYTAYSDYAYQLTPYYNAFGRDNIFTLVFEEFKENPQKSLNAIYQWLEVAPFIHEHTGLRANTTPEVYTRASGKGWLNKLRHSASWGSISPLMPRKIKSLGVGLAEEKTAKKLSLEERVQVYSTLNEVCAEKIAALELLTKRDYQIWRLDKPAR